MLVIVEDFFMRIMEGVYFEEYLFETRYLNLRLSIWTLRYAKDIWHFYKTCVTNQTNKNYPDVFQSVLYVDLLLFCLLLFICVSKYTSWLYNF